MRERDREMCKTSIIKIIKIKARLNLCFFFFSLMLFLFVSRMFFSWWHIHIDPRTLDFQLLFCSSFKFIAKKKYRPPDLKDLCSIMIYTRRVCDDIWNMYIVAISVLTVDSFLNSTDGHMTIFTLQMNSDIKKALFSIKMCVCVLDLNFPSVELYLSFF